MEIAGFILNYKIPIALLLSNFLKGKSIEPFVVWKTWERRLSSVLMAVHFFSSFTEKTIGIYLLYKFQASSMMV